MGIDWLLVAVAAIGVLVGFIVGRQCGIDESWRAFMRGTFKGFEDAKKGKGG